MTTPTNIEAQRALLDYWGLCGVDVDAALYARAEPRTQPAAPTAQSTGKPIRRATGTATARQDAGEAAPMRVERVQRPEAALETAAAMARGAESLQSLEKALLQFEHPLKAGARNMVFARGSATARIMLIGEAPGAEEDAGGQPFIGRSGQLLDRMLAAIGLGEDDFYITNIVNFRPPQNRSPSTEEIALSRPFLERHIELKKPDIIVAVGGVSASALLKTDTGITRLRGKIADITLASGAAWPCLPVLHPAFLLRNAEAKRASWLDLLTLKDWLDTH